MTKSLASLALTLVFVTGSMAIASEELPAGKSYQLPLLQRITEQDAVFNMSKQLEEQRDPAPVGELLGSEKSLELLTWLTEYAKAAAGDHTADLERFSSDLRAWPAATVKLVLLRLERERSHLRRISQTSRQLRQQSLKQARSTTGLRPTAPSSPEMNRALLPHRARFARKTTGRWNRYRPPRPLVNSRDVARFAVYRAIFPNW